MKFLLLLIVTFIYGGFSAELGNIDTPVDYSLAKIQPSDVTFIYYNNTAASSVSIVAGDKTTPIERRSNVFIVHGFAENGHLDWVLKIRDNFLTVGTFNIIIVDWSKAADNYEIGAANTKLLGKYIGDFILDRSIALSSVQIVASCLGAQAAGQAGKYINSLTARKIRRISAIDAAAHKFQGSAIPDTNKLQSSDAGYVDVTHSDGRNWGFNIPIGHTDFYANGGNVQPGCRSTNVTAEDICSHVTGNYLFAESILYISLSCKVTVTIRSTGLIATSLVYPKRVAVYGQWTSPASKGSYIFRTNNQPRYLRAVGGLI